MDPDSSHEEGDPCRFSLSALKRLNGLKWNGMESTEMGNHERIEIIKEATDRNGKEPIGSSLFSG